MKKLIACFGDNRTDANGLIRRQSNSSDEFSTHELDVGDASMVERSGQEGGGGEANID